MENRIVARVVTSLALFTAMWFYQGCAAPTQQLTETDPPPTSHWGGIFNYRYDPPESKAPVSVAATVVVVNPSYKEDESALGQQLYSKVGKGFSASMGVDMDKVIIAKGMTVKGPYGYLDEITYSDKKGADLTLAPKVFVTAQVEYIKRPAQENEWQAGKMKYKRRRGGEQTQVANTEWWTTRYVQGGMEEFRQEREFKMKIGGWITFVMQEPLSGEKMWLKRLELDEIEVEGVESYKAIPQYTTTYGFFGEEQKIFSGYSMGELAYDGKTEAMADALKKVYPTVMEKFWTYIDSDEILSMKEKVKEIRQLKRY